MSNWISIRGDGSDRLPPVWTRYRGKRRDGGVEEGLAITPFCASLGRDCWTHNNRPADLIAYQTEGCMTPLTPTPGER